MRSRYLGMSLRNYFVAVAAVYVCILTTLVVSGCMSENRARSLDEQRRDALAGVVKKDAQISDLHEAIKQGADATTAIIESFSTEVDGLRADLAEQVANSEPGSAVWQENVIAFIEGLADEKNELVGVIKDANDQLQRAEGGSVTDLILAGLVGLFPPAAVAVPIIRRSRNIIAILNRDFNGVVDAVAKGGGVVNATATRDAMNMIPGLKQRVTDRRVEIGDKEMKAVKAT